MFRATFLGHQGWLFRTEKSAILVDPLLHESFATYGGTTSGYRVHPPRAMNHAEFPALDGIVLSHEHEDHFDLPSLALVDRQVPIHLSARSSDAARTVLREMGFAVHALEPGVEATFGDLELLPMTADHVHFRTEDELDVLPFMIRDRKGHGSFFSSIDVPETDAMWRTMKARAKAPGIWTYTQNAGNWAFQQSWGGPDRHATERFSRRVMAAHDKLRTAWGAPEAVLLCGGGTSFEAPLEHLNHNAYPVDLSRAADALGRMIGDVPFHAATPGMTLAMEDGHLAAREECTFLHPHAECPARDYRGDLRAVESYPPAGRSRRLRREDMPELRTHLASLAEHLFGTPMFRALYSLSPRDLAPKKPTIALVLLADDDGGALVFEYVPQRCAFEPANTDRPMRDYLAGFECWATDLLALFRGDFAPSNMAYGHCRSWNAAPDSLDFDFGYSLRALLHPLRRPRVTLESYRRIARGLTDAPVIRAARAPRKVSPVAPDFFPADAT